MADQSINLTDVAGEILVADLKKREFQLWTDDDTHFLVSFSGDQETQVTSALKDHKSIHVRVKGRAERSPQGQILRITDVEDLALEPAGDVAFDHTAPSIESVIANLVRDVPSAEWDRLPADLTDNLDHYLYGTPRR